MDVFCIDSVNIDSIECIRDPCLVLRVLTVLKNPQSHLSKTFFRLKIGWILRKLWAGMCGCILTVVSAVSTNKIPYSIHNSIALIFCIACLDMPFNVHSNYYVDSNMKTSNYMKIRFKALIYFELHETLKSYFKLETLWIRWQLNLLQICGTWN